MAEVPLTQYAGFILSELVKAREAADAYSKSVAVRYAQDPLLRFFPAPRFKLPKMELTMPILVSGARFNETVRLRLSPIDFVAAMLVRSDEVRATVALAQATASGRHPRDIAVSVPSPAVERLAQEFLDRLTANPDPSHPGGIVAVMWAKIFQVRLDESELSMFYREWDPRRDLLSRTSAEVLDLVQRSTVVDRAEIQSLLVDPETNVVKNGGTPTSVFTIKADLTEEGVFVRSVRDDDTNQTHTVVEFE